MCFGRAKGSEKVLAKEKATEELGARELAQTHVICADLRITWQIDALSELLPLHRHSHAITAVALGIELQNVEVPKV